MDGGPLPNDGKVAALADLFERNGVSYAMGGAIALWYWGEPRGTVDIAVNVFLPSSRAGEIGGLLATLGVTVDVPRFEGDVQSAGQVRLDFAGTPLDLFFNEVPFHRSCEERRVRVPFAEQEVYVLSAEDLVVCKVMFNRTKDWADVEQVIATQGGSFDAGYVRGWLSEMLGRSDDIVLRFETTLRECGSET